MASITIRNLDDETKAKLRLRAARNQRSMEEEARVTLRQALTEESNAHGPSLPEAIRRRFAPFGGIDLEQPARGPIRKPPRPGR
jgi:plasmid stability protein